MREPNLEMGEIRVTAEGCGLGFTASPELRQVIGGARRPLRVPMGTRKAKPEERNLSPEDLETWWADMSGEVGRWKN